MKKHTHLWLALAFSFIVSSLFAQSKMLSMRDAIYNYQLYPDNIKGLGWIPGSHKFSYISEDGKSLMGGEAGTDKKESLLTLDQLNNSLPDTSLKFTALPGFTWVSGTRLVFTKTEKADKPLATDGRHTRYFSYDMAEGKSQEINYLPKDAEHTEMELHSLNLAYTVANNLYVATKGGKQYQVTRDMDKGILNGHAAHRREFGIEDGIFWSPKGNALAFYRMDERMVATYPMIRTDSRPATDTLLRYPMAGMKSHEVTVGVYNVNTQKTVYLKTGEPKEQYLTNISWTPDERYIYIAVLNRAQNHMWLNKYDAATGEFLKTLFEEKDEKYVEPLDPLVFLPGNQPYFIYLSQRDGYKHAYLYDTEGKLIRQAGGGEWQLNSILGFDEKGRNLYYTSTEGSPLGQQAYSFNIRSGVKKQITSGEGFHNVQICDDGAYILDDYSSHTAGVVRNISVLQTSNGKRSQELLNAKDPIADYKLGKTRIFTIKAADGKTPLYCRMITPANFDPTKKYPVVVYVYGGPHAQMVSDRWLAGSNLWMQYMAQQGYIMFTVDNRGSGNRGMAFEQATFRNLGTEEMKDQMKGVEYLQSLPYVDTARMGVHGWSFGGFMTTSLMSRYPGAFKVGVAGGPVIDWRYYEVMYTERYMDTPEENPEGYETADLLNHVKDLKGRLMLIHGTVDDVVVWQHSLMFVKKAVDEGIMLDYFVYPGHPHNVRGKDRIHLMDKVTLYFNDYLK